jgi:hypothetical protein
VRTFPMAIYLKDEKGRNVRAYIYLSEKKPDILRKPKRIK